LRKNIRNFLSVILKIVSQLISKTRKELSMDITRKQNREGSVFKVSENKWISKICLGTALDGKVIVKQFSGKTEAIVKALHTQCFFS